MDRRLGKASGRRVPTDRAEEVDRLYRERYLGFTVKQFHEHLINDHGFGWLKLHLQWAGVVAKTPRKGMRRRKRERRPLPGMMLQDGSRHEIARGPGYADRGASTPTWTRPRLAHSPAVQQNQTRRTLEALPKPDNSIRYRHAYVLGATGHSGQGV